MNYEEDWMIWYKFARENSLSVIDEKIKSVPPKKCSLDYGLALLIATAPMKHSLKNRSDFYNKFKWRKDVLWEEFKSLFDGASILSGLK